MKDWCLLTFGALMSKARLGSENVAARIVFAEPSPPDRSLHKTSNLWL